MQAVHPLQMRRRPSPAVYRRRRFAVLLLAIALTAIVWLGLHQLAGLFGGGSLSAAEQPVSVHTALVAHTVDIVQPGDTLWSIARRAQPSGDIRPLVNALAAQRHGQPLQVGETIDVAIPQ